MWNNQSQFPERVSRCGNEDYAVTNPDESQRAKYMLYSNVTGYYPYGLPWSNLQGTDRYMYSGKDLDRTNGLMLYDFHARLYDPQLGRFLQPDPLSSSYPAQSPWLYCAANPIMCTDPTGMELIFSPDGTFLFNKLNGDDRRYILAPVDKSKLTNSPNSKRFHTPMDFYKEQAENKEYMLVNSQFLDRFESMITESIQAEKECAFSYFDDGSVSSLFYGEADKITISFNFEESHYSASQLKSIMHEFHTHEIGVSSNRTTGYAGPSDADMKGFRSLKFDGVVGTLPHPEIKEDNVKTFGKNINDLYIQFYNGSKLIGDPINLAEYINAIRKVLNY